MTHQFRKHYTIEEARTLLPQIRTWLNQINRLHKQVAEFDQRVAQVLAQGSDAGGPLVNDLIKDLSEMKATLGEFQRRQIQIKDLERGLIDFPALLGGREVFLCWEQDEEDIEYWHDLDAGYAGRERI